MKRLKFVFCLFSFIFLGQTLFALSSVGGVSGLIRIPTAEALHYKEISLSYDFVYGNSASEDRVFYSVNLGTFENWELGVVGGTRPDEGVFVNTKYYLMSDESRYPVSIAIGAENLGSTDLTAVYMVASKIFQGGFSMHLGFKALFDGEIMPSLMGGAEYFLTNEFAVLGDIHQLEGTYTVNGGVLFYLTDDIVFRATVLDFSEASEYGLSYSVGIVFSKYL